jgi:hypothetical protein
MTEHYTHFDPMDFGEVPEIQAALLAKKPEAVAKERPVLTLVKMTEASASPPDSQENTRQIKAS